MTSELSTQHSALPLKRRPEIRVGDLLQYRYSYGSEGFKHWAMSTREVIEVLDGGATFVVEGFWNVPAVKIVTHIPMHAEPERGDDSYEFTGVRD